MAKPKLLLLNTPEDAPWAEELKRFLAPVVSAGKLELRHYSPTEAVTGDCSWTERQLREVDGALLLVSSNLLGSPYWDLLREHLVAAFRERDGFTVMPVILNESLWREDPFLEKFQALPSTFMPCGYGARFWKTVADELLEAVATNPGRELP